MAYVSGSHTKKDEEEINPSQVSTGRGSNAIAPAPVAGGPVAQQSNPQNNQKTFAGILDYVKANKAQTAGLANQLGNSVTSAGQNARNTLASGTKQFNQDVDKNTVNLDQNVFNKANTDPTSLVGGVKDPNALLNETHYNTGLTKNPVNASANRQVNASAFPTSGSAPQPSAFPVSGSLTNNRVNASSSQPNNNFNFAGAPKVESTGVGKAQDNLDNLSDLKTFLNMRDAEYKGPNSLEETDYYKPIDESFDKAETATENARTEQGNRSLLEDLQTDQVGYANQGSLLLNQALLRGDLDARQTLQNAANSNSDLEGLLTGASTAATNKATSGASTTAATKQKIQDTIGGKQGSMERDLTRRSGETLKQAEVKSQQITNTLLSGGTPTDEQLADLGVSPQQWHELQDDLMLYKMQNGSLPEGMDLQNYIETQLPQISPQNIASADEYATYQALNRLMGTDNTFLSDPSLAGTATTDNIDFDIDAALRDMEMYGNLSPEEPTVSTPAAGKKYKMGQGNNIASARHNAAAARNGTAGKKKKDEDVQFGTLRQE